MMLDLSSEDIERIIAWYEAMEPYYTDEQLEKDKLLKKKLEDSLNVKNEN